MNKYYSIILIPFFLYGCVTDSKKALFATDESQVQLRSYQTRSFDTSDTEKTLRTVIATMQDLGFVISKADATIGVVSGSKYANRDSALLTVSVRAKGDNQVIVRANVQQHLKAVEKPELYQDFFNALGKAMFLTAQAVD